MFFLLNSGKPHRNVTKPTEGQWTSKTWAAVVTSGLRIEASGLRAAMMLRLSSQLQSNSVESTESGGRLLPVRSVLCCLTLRVTD